MAGIRIDDFTRYTYLSGIKHSADGKHACFVVHHPNLEDNNYHSNLWLINVESEQYYQLTSFDKEKSFLWLDNETILFSDIRDPKDQKNIEAGEEFTQYYRITINRGEAVKAFKIPRAVNSIKIVDPDTYLFLSDYNANQNDLYPLSGEEKSEELRLRKEEKDYEVLEEIPFWSNGDGFTSRRRSRLYKFHVQTGMIEPVTDEWTNVETISLNRDKNKAVMVVSRFLDKMPLTNELLEYDLVTNTLRQISSPASLRHYSANYLADDTLVFTASDMKHYGINENKKFFIMNGTSPLCISTNLDASVTNSVGSDCRYGSSDVEQADGNYLYFVTTENDSSVLNRIDSTGKIDKLSTGNGSVDGISVMSDSILFIGMKTDQLQEIYKLKSTVEKQLTTMNNWVKTERSISLPEKITVETELGIQIDGWIIKPIGFDSSRKYPAILDIHGGPKTIYGSVFFHEMQYWANEGYVVFFCNPRGSDGKGNTFADIRGKYGTIDYDDIMKFTDAVLEKCIYIDRARLGVTGGSYGGYMTNWIIGHTHRFKAAASQRSISNWISKHCTTDIGYYFVEDQNAGSPWNNQEKFWERSPLKYADRVKTPTLFLHSDEDYRCWLAEGLQMFTALKYHGVESRMCIFKGENHELSRSGKPKHRLRRLREITEWFNRFLKE